jgi:hypothetical protein
MKDIRIVVKNKTWQSLRESMSHTWTSERNAKRNLTKLKRYLDNTANEDKLRRVHNYLAALRGKPYPEIRRMRNQIKHKRISLGYTH